MREKLIAMVELRKRPTPPHFLEIDFFSNFSEKNRKWTGLETRKRTARFPISRFGKKKGSARGVRARRKWNFIRAPAKLQPARQRSFTSSNSKQRDPEISIKGLM